MSETPATEAKTKPFDPKAWLDTEIEWRRPYRDSVKVPRHEQLCFLVFANGGLNVGGWGFITTGIGHQSGLDQDDGLALLSYSSYMAGLEDAGVPIYDVFLESYFKAYREKWEGIAKQHQEERDRQRAEREKDKKAEELSQIARMGIRDNTG